MTSVWPTFDVVCANVKDVLLKYEQHTNNSFLAIAFRPVGKMEDDKDGECEKDVVKACRTIIYYIASSSVRSDAMVQPQALQDLLAPLQDCPNYLHILYTFLIYLPTHKDIVALIGRTDKPKRFDRFMTTLCEERQRIIQEVLVEIQSTDKEKTQAAAPEILFLLEMQAYYNKL